MVTTVGAEIEAVTDAPAAFVSSDAGVKPCNHDWIDDHLNVSSSAQPAASVMYAPICRFVIGRAARSTATFDRSNCAFSQSTEGSGRGCWRTSSSAKLCIHGATSAAAAQSSHSDTCMRSASGQASFAAARTTSRSIRQPFIAHLLPVPAPSSTAARRAVSAHGRA
jgi:hypothetical protein